MSPESDAADLNGREERGGVFCVAGGNATPAFEVEKSIFHQMTKFVEIPVVFPLDFAVLPRRYHWLHALLGSLLKDRVGIIPAIRHRCSAQIPSIRGKAWVQSAEVPGVIRTRTGRPSASTARCILVLSPLLCGPCPDCLLLRPPHADGL